MRHILSVSDLTAVDLGRILDRAEAWRSRAVRPAESIGPMGALILERPALRTRIAYERAFQHLGGRLTVFERGVGTRDSVEDLARVLSRMVDVALLRTRDHGLLEALAATAEIPIINALSNVEHPVEVLADALVLRDVFGDPTGRRIAFIGDGGNVCASVLLLAPLLGMDVSVATPEAHAPRAEAQSRARELAAAYGTRVSVCVDPGEAVSGASAIYTDGWAAYESPEEREAVFAPYRVTADLMGSALPDAIFLHCLPAERGAEVTDEVLDGPRSHAFARLGNLAPTSAALIEWLLEGSGE